MSIDYIGESEKYRPEEIRTLLIGESPPPSGRTYFYVPREMSGGKPLELDSSLPATIFGHYFRRRPASEPEYAAFLRAIQGMGIFLIDLCDEPIRVRGNPQGLERIKHEIPQLRSKIRNRNISVDDKSICFLLARTNYLRIIKSEFPHSRYVRWKEFRLTTE